MLQWIWRCCCRWPYQKKTTHTHNEYIFELWLLISCHFIVSIDWDIKFQIVVYFFFFCFRTKKFVNFRSFFSGSIKTKKPSISIFIIIIIIYSSLFFSFDILFFLFIFIFSFSLIHTHIYISRLSSSWWWWWWWSLFWSNVFSFSSSSLVVADYYYYYYYNGNDNVDEYFWHINDFK